jgi:chromate transporter
LIHNKVPFYEAFKFWLKLGFIGFGGPAGQISIMHTEVVERKKWVSEGRFLHALNYCMMLPGPEAQQLATYLGWLMHGPLGGITAGLLFIIPSLIFMTVLSWLYISFGELPVISALMYGVKPAVVAVVAYAILNIGRKAIKNWFAAMLAVFAFAALYFFGIPFPLIILSAGLAGFIASYISPDFYPKAIPSDSASEIPYMRPSFARTALQLTVGAVLWIVPLIVLTAWLSWDNIFKDISLFFTKVAFVTFGGAYAVLPYVAQHAIDIHGWITPHQMIAGLALGEMTPGPLIKIVAFIGFLGVWQTTDLGILGAIAGAFAATYYTFLPSFLFILIGAPIIEASRGMTKLSAALSAITAAVVGVIFNLAVFFSRHVFLPEDLNLDIIAVLIAAAAFICLWRFKLNILYVILLGGIAGMFYKLQIL